MFTQINDIEKLPKKITYNGNIYEFTIYMTVWHKFCVAYRDCISHICACCVVVDKEHYDIKSDNDNIGEATTLEEAVNMLYEYVMNNPNIEVEQ